MSNKSYYFDHDYDARNDQKILVLRCNTGWEGYGIYMATCEILCQSKGYIHRDALNGVAFGLNIPTDKYESFLATCISAGLFMEDESGIYSARILEHIRYREFLSEAGKRGGRGNKGGDKAPLNPPLSQAEALKKNKEKKEDEGNTPSDIHGSVMITDIEMLRSIFYGEQFIENCCMKLGVEKGPFTDFVKRWVSAKEVTGDFVYNKHRLRTFLLSDYEKEKKNGKTFELDKPKMTRKIGEK